jgi:hypothetical protein
MSIDVDWNIREVWYVSQTLPSKGLIGNAVRGSLVFGVCVVLSSFGCATGTTGARSASDEASEVALVPGASPTVAAETTLTFAGARCSGASCRCREPGQDDAETAPPGEGSKRFEIGLSVASGTASLDLSELGTVASDRSSGEEICAYIDIPSGSTHDAVFVAKESVPDQGMLPRLRIAEYGPKARTWYDVVAVSCVGRGGRCDRAAAAAWATSARQRKRGRLDPCGSSVVSKLAWETSGGQAERRGGVFRDFTVRFTMEVKRFATQFARGSTECLPK